VEKVQHRATKLVPHLKHLSYEEWLVALRFPSLLFRRWRGDMVMNGIDRLDRNHSPTEHSMNEPEVTIRGYSWGAVDLKSGKPHSVSEWFGSGTHYQIMSSQPLP